MREKINDALSASLTSAEFDISLDTETLKTMIASSSTVSLGFDITVRAGALFDLLGFSSVNLWQPPSPYASGILYTATTEVDNSSKLVGDDISAFLRESYVYLCSDKLGQGKSICSDTTGKLGGIVAKIPIGSVKYGSWSYASVGKVIDLERLDERLDFYILRKDGTYVTDARFEVELIFSPDTNNLVS